MMCLRHAQCCEVLGGHMELHENRANAAAAIARAAPFGELDNMHAQEHAPSLCNGASWSSKVV